MFVHINVGLESQKKTCGREKVSVITSPIMQPKCLSKNMAGSLHPFGLPLGQKPTETGLTPKQLFLVCIASLLKENALIQLPQERNNLTHVH